MQEKVVRFIQFYSSRGYDYFSTLSDSIPRTMGLNGRTANDLPPIREGPPCKMEYFSIISQTGINNGRGRTIPTLPQ